MSSRNKKGKKKPKKKSGGQHNKQNKQNKPNKSNNKKNDNKSSSKQNSIETSNELQQMIANLSNQMNFDYNIFSKKKDNKNENENNKNEIKEEEFKEILEDEDYIYKMYKSENQMKIIQDLCAANLSEPYSVFTFRYFVLNWPELCYFAHLKNDINNKCVGLIVSELKIKRDILQGYIAMLVVDKSQRRKGLGTKLVQLSVNKMKYKNADICILETELSNKGALQLYKKLGFIRDKYYKSYYLNGSDAYRLTLHLKDVSNKYN